MGNNGPDALLPYRPDKPQRRAKVNTLDPDNGRQGNQIVAKILSPKCYARAITYGDDKDDRDYRVGCI